MKTVLLNLLCSLLLSFGEAELAFNIEKLTREELKNTFGVEHIHQVPEYKLIDPEIYQVDKAESSFGMIFPVDDSKSMVTFHPVDDDLFNDRLVYAEKGVGTVAYSDEGLEWGHDGFPVNVSRTEAGVLEVLTRSEIRKKFHKCHFHAKLNTTYAAISTCDNQMKGVWVRPEGVYVIHPFPQRHQNRSKRAANAFGTHVVYKRNAGSAKTTSTSTEATKPKRRRKSRRKSRRKAAKDFCGLKSSFMEEEELGFGDAFVNRYAYSHDKSALTIELAIFVDYKLWEKFSGQEGAYADSKLRNYVVTVMNNIQLMYHSPTIDPKVNFKIVHYEIFKSQPSELSGYQHDYGNAQKYLHRFCKYQGRRGGRTWDHAFLLSGYNLHRGRGSTSISGIARLHGMCDIWNSCTLAEGLDFTSVFIGTHELGHSLGMRHDEPYCSSTYIMSGSLGPGKVKWSTCSMKDFHKFISRLNYRGKNCLKKGRSAEMLQMETSNMPGQTFTADDQCALMHGSGYKMIIPRKTYSNGICHMMWCGQSGWGRIITSHPALEGTHCEGGRWCIEGRCVDYDNYNHNKYSVPSPVNGGWSSWSSVSCGSCSCSPFPDGIGMKRSERTCTDPSPLNGGSECGGPSVRGIVCNLNCGSSSQTLEDHANTLCWGHRNSRKDYDLTGYGRQLLRYENRACKVFCDVKDYSGSASRSYRHFGDTFPDGVNCGTDRYCIDGECVRLSCGEKALIKSDDHCPNSYDTCSIPSKKRSLAKSSTNSVSKDSWGSWESWSSCSQSCGRGYRSRNRVCPSGSRCTGSGQLTETCNLGFCSWSDWSSCSATCGSGTKRRNRFCPGGGCLGVGDEERTCEDTKCVLWSSWSGWSHCSMSCGRGRRVRQRNCGGPTCSQYSDEDKKETEDCNVGYCPWESWRSCSVSCGSGTRYRYRLCPGGGCEGDDGLMNRDHDTCYETSCSSGNATSRSSRNGRWSGWSLWSYCSQTCGGYGSRKRHRTCLSGSECWGAMDQKENCGSGSSCNSLDHPYGSKGKWTAWSSWSYCSATCGGGIRTRNRVCMKGICRGEDEDRENCSEGSCESWGYWGTWSSCSRTCGSGVRSRTRTCLNSPCFGHRRDRETCNAQSCSSFKQNDDDNSSDLGVWGNWDSWSSCSQSCGVGVESRMRQCYYGSRCRGRKRERRVCPRRPCAKWGGWGHWSTCSRSCGDGIKRRVRNCYGHGDCPGDKNESNSCYHGGC